MSERAHTSLIFHAGALGDFVLTWPLVRAFAAVGLRPTVIAADSHARLARRCLGVRTLSGERREATALWRDHSGPDLAAAWSTLLNGETPGLILSFVADEHSGAGKRWLATTRQTFANAEIICVGGQASPSHVQTWTRFNVAALGQAPARSNPDGPIVLHVGAGGRDKRWPLEQWRSLAGSLRSAGRLVLPIAGEVEREQADDPERAAFLGMGGRVLLDLDELADTLERAFAFIGADTGPTHLAAQLGIPTLALFGPTDPRVWSPVGPSVRVLAPGSPHPMTWVDHHTVQRGLDHLLTAAAAPEASA